MNQRKGTWNVRILDPFEIGHGWFEILLPHLEMVVVEELIPIERRADAHFTFETLRIGDDDDILEIRRDWYEQFTDGDLTLSRLQQRAPLIARAVRKRLEEVNAAAFDEARPWFEEFMAGHHGLKTLRLRVPHVATLLEDTLSRPDSRVRRRS